MLRLDLQFFASKKGVGSTKTVVTLSQNVLVLNAPDGQTVTGGSILYRQRGTKFIQVLTLVVVAMTLYTRKLTA